MLEPVLKLLVALIALACLVTTLLPMTQSSEWWIRACDFPRLQIAVLSLVGAVAALLLYSGAGRLVAVALLACALLQVVRILPYTMFADTEIAIEPATGTSLRVLAANVLLENSDYARTIRLIEETDPDAVLLMETDERWQDALADVLRRYPTVISEPRDNYYGMIFATRLETSGAEMVYLTEDETPTLFARLSAHDGAPFHLVGLHPRPPVPGQNTDDRDEQIHKAATFAHRKDIPVIAMGDFNDVSWSVNSRHFKSYGGYLDPRIGRGFFSSFDANRSWLRFPIDQFYVTEGIALHGLRRGPHIGSDHFPMIADVSITGMQE